MILLAAAGLLSMLAQVVVLRELVAALFGVELLYVVALGTWLVGTALGAMLGRGLPDRPGLVAMAFITLGALTMAELAMIRTAGVAFGAVPGAYLPFPVQLGGVLAAAFPPSLICGLVFTPLVRLAAGQGCSASRAYASECAGAAAGGLVVTALFWAGLSTMQAAMLTLAASTIAAALAVVRRRAALGAWVGLAAALGAAAIWGPAGAWDTSLLRWQYPSLAAAEDTPYARVVVTRAGNQIAVFANGALAFDTEGTGAEAFADLAALQLPRPSRALVIGGGVEGVAAALAAHGIADIDNVEIDERADRLARGVIGPGRRAEGRAPSVRVVYGEARRFLEDAQPYDLILVATPPPTSGETSRFYTQEFFAACRRRLRAGGVVAIRLPAAENFWPPPLIRLVSSVLRAIEAEFPVVSVIPGATMYAFGSAAVLPDTAEMPVQRLLERRLAPRRMTPPYLRYLYGNDRRDELRRVLTSIRSGGVNRDAAPVAYAYAARLWLSRFYPRVAAGDGPFRPTRVRGWIGGSLAIAAVALWWGSRTRARASIAVMLVVAAATMALEAVALLRYQVANGVMFVNVGGLLTCFMGGMALGSWAGDSPPARRWLARRPWLLAVGVCVTAAAVLLMTRWPALAGLAGTGALLALTGLAAGGTFAAMTHERSGDASRTAGSLYAADVAGGALAAWLAPLVLVPTVGLDGTAALAAVTALALLPLCATLGRGRR